MNPKLFSVFSTDTGLRFNIRIVDEGDKYGLDFCQTYEPGSRGFEQGNPFVEFYDSRYPHTEYGQFVTRYHADQIQSLSSGLDLMVGDNHWKLCAESMTQVRYFIDWYLKQVSV